MVRNRMSVLRRMVLVTLGVSVAIMSGCSQDSAEGRGAQETTEAAANADVTGQTDNEAEPETIVIDKCSLGNPIAGSASKLLYGGDPSALVDGDTLYLYTGHDVSTKEESAKSIYNIPEYLCYSTKDMINWQEEGVVMTMDTVEWASNATSAWASQVMKHYDPEKNQDLYYLYYCTWDKTGKQCIAVATSDSPTGPFTDIGQPLVKGSDTKPSTSAFNDIDPTAWIEVDSDGVEHRYLAWGNGMFFVCELNEDMVSVTDLNGDGQITSGKNTEEADIIIRTNGLNSYTEAPWLYRRQDENGNYYGDYYLFFAHQWRECMAYATTDDLLNGEWSDTHLIMNPTSTSNTNHMAVCDFNGQTYFIYHNGSLPNGNGFRRSACVRKLEFNEDGSIDLMEESAAGVSGEACSIALKDGGAISHPGYINSLFDSDYPYGDVELGMDLGDSAADSLWVIRPGKADENNEAYVSIESENKPGLYITGKKDGGVILSQDTSASEEFYNRQTFETVKGLADDEGVSFRCIQYADKYLSFADGKLCLTDGSDAANSTFYFSK